MNVLIVGDYCQDIFVKGRAERLCPEAPCPVLNPTSTDYNDGMAGNVAANVRSLAPDSYIATVFQSDEIKKTRFVDEASGYILLRVDENDKVSTPVTFERIKAKIEACRPLDGKFDFVLISDYNKGFLTEDVIKQLVDYCKEWSMVVFLDTKKLLGPWSRNVDFVKINEKEYEEQLKHDKPLRFCRDLIVTLGGRGSKHMNTSVLVPSEHVEVMDVSGAGDTYFAAFALQYHRTKGDIIASMKYANKAAAVAVSKHGVVTVRESEFQP